MSGIAAQSIPGPQHSTRFIYEPKPHLYVGLLGGAVAGGAPDLLLNIAVPAAVFAVVACRVLAIPRAEATRTCIPNTIH
jgi:hypothetical protein